MRFILLALLLFIGCQNERKSVPCDECGGMGVVTYGEDHPISKMGFNPGEYQCPMCRGCGKLIKE